MRAENILDAMQNIDIRLILEADPTASPRKSFNWLKWIPIAACFCLIASIVGFYATVVFGGAQSPAPGNPDATPPPFCVKYQSFEELSAAIGKETLFNGSSLDLTDSEIILTFDENDRSKPHHAEIASANTLYYILLGCQDIDNPYGGFEKPGQSLDIGGVTVYYSEYFADDLYRSHAKFVYDGDLYVIDNNSPSDDFDIIAEVTKILGGRE